MKRTSTASRILVTADIHLNDNPRDAYRHKWQEELRATAKEYDVDTVAILGDITDARDHHSAWLVNTVVEHFHQLTQLCHVVVLAGNHDGPADGPFWTFLQRIPYLTYVDRPLGHPVAISERLRGCLFLPYTPNPEREWAKIDFRHCRMVFCHQTFAGASIGARKLDGVPLTVFPEGLPVISGDIHVPQKIGQLRYVGAPYLCNFGDDYKPRMLLIEGESITSITCSGPQKRLIECKLGQPLPTGNRSGADKGDILKIRVSLRPDQMEKFPEFKQEVQAWGEKHGYSINSVQATVTGDAAARERPDQSAHKPDKQVVLDYGKLRNIDDRTLKTGLWLMEQK